jgi:general secretion pathway protein A
LLELETLLSARRRERETTVLIVDEAQSLPQDLLEEIRLLANIETDSAKLLSVVMAGQPELAERLNDRSLRQLKQRVALRAELRPLTAHQTAEYLAGRIRAAGGLASQVFTRQAVMTIYERSRGIPRTISVIADNALLSAFALQLRPVTSEVVLEVCRDFDLAAPSPAAEADAGGTTPVPASPAGQSPQGPQPLAAPPPAPVTRGRLLDIDPAVIEPVAVDAPSPSTAEAQGPDPAVARASGFGRLRWFFS